MNVAGKNGSVLVVGGGIAGIQASLDLADSGYKVYMVEEKSAIGGHMAQLDKTFPTNDCAMCTISPRLVSAGLHRNIEIITTAELGSLEGEAGNFEATINIKPSYVDFEKCTGCGLCAAECPVSVPDAYNQRLNNRKAIYKLYPQAVPNKFVIDKLGNAPCYDACPVHGDPSGYVALTAQGRYREALDLVLEKNPFPGICGRICDHPCETSCNRCNIDEPLSIAYIKRFLSDWNTENPEDAGEEKKKNVVEDNGKKVAIIGAGPAGLTAALELRKKGYLPTIFEAQPVPGGMLTLGIPAYRLPSNIIEKEIKDILDYGIELKTNSPVKSRSEIDQLFDDGFEAVFLSVGSHRGRRMGIDGEDLEDIINGVDFLREVRLGVKTSVKKRVIVLGGGNVALDCARSALRLGADKVTLVCLEEYSKMPAHRAEIDWAEDEGITISDSSATSRIMGENGKFTGLELLHVKSMSFVEGRLALETEPGTEKVIEADELIVAIGQVPDLSFLGSDKDLKLTRRGTIDADRKTMKTSVKGIFSGGDVVRGAASVIEAVADGRRGAEAIDAFISGKIYEPEEEIQPIVEISREELKNRKEPVKPRTKMSEADVSTRTASFEEVDNGFTEEQAKKEAERCLYCAVCSNCRRCAEVCEAKALVYNDQPKQRKLNVGAVILASGFKLYDSARKGEFGYRRFPNVISALDYERVLSASGPSGGHIQRISDSKEPRKVAFIQCVGSRDKDNPYCSSVCCTYAIKQAIITKEHLKDAECTIFAMDIRAFGKGFDEYYERAKKDYGVKIVYTRPSSIKQDFATKNLRLQFTEDGTNWMDSEYDLVVLAAGLCGNEKALQTAKACGIDLNEYSFAASPLFQPSASSRKGVYLAGTVEEPKDIPETVTQASAAAAHAMELLSDVRGSEVVDKVYPPEKDVSGLEPRIGVFVCHCGSNIHGVVDCEAIAEYAGKLKNVVYTNHLLYTCSPDGLSAIREMVAENDLNRVVVASCTPRTHEPLFQENIKEAGLNPYLFEMANIRDQCTWVHANFGSATQEKAKDLVRMAVGRARLIEPLLSKTYVPRRQALVIGGGISGMTSALSIADQGFEVFLVEQKGKLGGELYSVKVTIEGEDPVKLLEDIIARIEQHKKIKVFMNSEVVDTSGFSGNFKSTIRNSVETASKDVEVEHGVTVIATGANELNPEEYMHGQSDNVLTQHGLEELMAEDPESFKNVKEVVMVQCVGSREPGRMVCSRVCCTEAIKNALILKKINPEISISILYRDIRTYGFREKYYTEAREKGVMFFRYDLDGKPTVSMTGAGGLDVDVKDLNSMLDIKLSPDKLVLSAGMMPSPDNAKLATTFKVPVNLEGFCLEAHMKLRPVDFASDGIFLCGTCHGPKFIRESITQAKATAARAVSIISSTAMQISCVVSKVDPDKCAGCLTCVRTCPYNVPRINDDGVAEIEAAICHGCGVCASECPAKAIDLMHYKDSQVISKTGALYRESAEMKHDE